MYRNDKVETKNDHTPRSNRDASGKTTERSNHIRASFDTAAEQRKADSDSDSAGDDRGGTGAPRSTAHAAESGEGQTEKASGAFLHSASTHRNAARFNPTKKVDAMCPWPGSVSSLNAPTRVS
jgi:hypothetical protein